MYSLTYTQNIPLTLEKAWEFFSSPQNLRLLTPEYLDFKITNSLPGSTMYPGEIIVYTIKPLCKIPMTWVTEITHVKERLYFIDEQRVGPYSIWHHEHWFKPIDGGVEMRDILYYKMPFGVVGKLFHTLKVQNDIQAIFRYREEKIKELFGQFNSTC